MFSLFSIILRHKKLVILVTVSGFLVSAALSFVIPPRYISTVAFMPAGVENELAGSGGFFSNLGMLGDTYATLVRIRRNFIIDYIVRSRTMSRLMSEKFDLQKKYKADSEEEVIKELQKCTSVIVRDEGILEVAVEDRNPVQARDMALAYVEYIDSMLVDMVVEGSKSKYRYLEKEKNRRKYRLAESDSTLQFFIEQHGIYDVQQQARAAFLVLAGISAREKMLEVEKRILEVSFREGNPELDKINLELEKLEEQLIDMVEGDGGGALFPPLKDIPGIGAEYMFLVSEKMLQEFALAFVMVKLEDAGISASEKVSVIRIIDPPYIPEIRSWPKRKQIVMVFTLASLFWVCFVLLVLEQFREGRFLEGEKG